MATNKNFVIDQGATFSANIQFLDTNKNPISLAGYNVRSKMRASYDSANAVAFIATVSNATTGNVNIFLDSANTSLLHYGRYVYDAEAYSADHVVRIVEGAITVSPGVSGNNMGSILKQSINSLVNGNYSMTLDANGSIIFPDLSIQNTAFVSNNYITKINLKNIVANSISWAEFQANIAAL